MKWSKSTKKKTSLSLRKGTFCPLTEYFVQESGCSQKSFLDVLWARIDREKSRSKKFFSLEKRVEHELKALLTQLLWKRNFSEEKRGDPNEVYLLEQLADLPWNHSFPLLRVLFSLCHFLLQLSDIELGISSLDCGAIPLLLGEYQPCPLPYQPEHMQLGVFLLLLGLLKQEKAVLEMGLRLGLWQQKLLCFGSSPAWGVFARLGADTRWERMALYELLRQGMSLCFKNNWTALDDFSQVKGEISPLWVLIEQYFFLNPPCCDVVVSAEKIENWDPSCGLFCVQTEQEASYFTLHGGKTGLGALHKRRVELVTYGPSYAPFEGMDGFGIEAHGYLQEGLKKIFFQRDHHKIGIKTCVRMVDQPSRTPSGIARFRGIWLDVRQEWQSHILHLETKILSLEGWDDVGMRFLVRADQVKEEKTETGRVLHFYSGEESIKLQSLQIVGKWQLQRIEEPAHYWGANWQAVFLFTNAQANYSWSIEGIAKLRDT